jgi:hypothetical protein
MAVNIRPLWMDPKLKTLGQVSCRLAVAPDKLRIEGDVTRNYNTKAIQVQAH